MPALIIEICPHEPRTSACLPDGSPIASDPGIASDMADCRASGDVSEACEYVRDALGVDWRIVAPDELGEYKNRATTDAELEATARAIYFESSADFTDRDTCETYLIWSAACDLEGDEA